MKNHTNTQGKSEKNHDIKERIVQYIDYMRISGTKFYQETGVSYGILSKNNRISEDNIVKILTTYRDLSTDWLLLGEGDMFKSVEKQITQSVKDSKNSVNNTGNNNFFNDAKGGCLMCEEKEKRILLLEKQISLLEKMLETKEND